MSLVNDLIRRSRAEPPPEELTIRDNQVGTLAAHAEISLGCYVSAGLAETSPDQEQLKQIIRQGKLRFCGIRVRVIGQLT